MLLKSTLGSFVNQLLSRHKLFLIYRSGNAIGDHIAMTGMVRLIYKQYGFKSIVLTTYPEAFHNNKKVYKLFDFKTIRFKGFVRAILRLVRGSNVDRFLFDGDLSTYMRRTKSKISLIEAHSMHFVREFDYRNLNCELFFSSYEKQVYGDLYGKYKGVAVILPISKDTYTPVKGWGFKKYQSLVDLLSNYTWIQVGLCTHNKLDGVIDLRGKTTLRELFYLVSIAKFTIADEGLINHITSCFKTVKSFVVMSGFTHIEYIKYKNTITISREPQVHCAPCWLLNECPMDKKYCTEDISLKNATSIIRKHTTN
jgi:hypothetical protein